jgi:1-phosphofructokinase
MIYTITLNPSIDFVVEVETLQLHQVNRMKKEHKYPGGKGINVARVLHRLGAETTALGFVGGFTGRFIEEALRQEGIPARWIRVNEDTRINIKLKTGENEETEINGQGPSIPPEAFQQLNEQLEQVRPGDTVVMSGSIPPSLSPSVYEEWTAILGARGVRVAVDVAGPALKRAANRHVFLLKPNHHELGQLYGVRLNTMEDVVVYGRKLQQAGAAHVIVSMAGQGALLFTEDATYRSTAPKGAVVHPVGAGDSMVAAFLADYEKTNDAVSAFKTAVAAGSATAFSPDLCTKEQVEQLRKEIDIEAL